MKAIKRFQAEDGKVFDNEFDCMNYEKKTELIELLKEKLSKLAYNGMRIEDIEEMLLENAKDFGNILTKIGKFDK